MKKIGKLTIPLRIMVFAIQNPVEKLYYEKWL